MRARMTIAEIHAGKMKEIVGGLPDSVYSIYRQQQGFRGVMLLTDVSTQKAISITLWETESDLMAGEASTQEQRARMADLFTAPRVTHNYEVSVQV